MNDDDFKKNPEPTHNEGDARFDVTSLDEVKDENGNGIFHMTRRFKWILILSLLLLIANGVLIWAVYNDKLVAEVWQLSLWCVCAILAFYSVAKRSLATVILNYVLFFGVSLIPVWLKAHENIQATIKLFSE
ncbi:MAG: hypothetical protein IKE46_03395 [Selenomonadaceae bacterium]|nr:hypothetical protein [Selenomonadaceae bacterium]